uniref:Coat protein n=1 Tax=Japanese plum-yew deltapartitivirus TaxID=2933090 RepID=A0A9C7GWN8_9VIRU|nr:putative coat protein [Japanese plum-yew deltapartitivirus]CAI5383960.1 putative coat protein [Japanese plum-yew deltapartitivirus]
MDSVPREPRDSIDSSPTGISDKRRSVPTHEPGTRSKIATRIEFPKMPPAELTAFEQISTDEVEVGNTRYNFVQQTEGYVGHRFSREKLEKTPTYINIDVVNIQTAIGETLTGEFSRLLRAKGVLDSNELLQRAAVLADWMVNGASLLIFLKLQEIHFTDWTQYRKFAEGPRIVQEIEIPLPYALCIQQLGTVKINSMTTEMTVIPTYPTNVTDFFLTDTNWNAAEHAENVAYVKALGVPCSTVNLSTKIGSAWWLMRQETVDGTVRISCPLPESNFTEAGTVMNSMFLTGRGDPVINKIADLTPLGIKNYGIMLQNPRRGIQVAAFHALCGSDDNFWRS